ncbi:diguanylate cyclase [Cereibacter johrii]|uniref:GGDEF domain-containing protein n=1 Tax=Cereibacter johrii TaxID=445629 RepID=UPI002B25A8DE|nr:diguanylate cyclase [Cereibacter johrii]MEA5162761.1 diguanylate cyclase [Cereibacter johrii]
MSEATRGAEAIDFGPDAQDLLWLSQDLVAVFDADDRLCAANPAYCETFDCDPAEAPSWRQIMRRNHAMRQGALIAAEDFEGWLAAAAASRGQVAFRAYEAALHDGRRLWITETVAPDGRMLVHATDVTRLRSESLALRSERDAAQRASWTDPLTGVPNRRFVMDRLERWLDQQPRHGTFGTHALAVMDLDRFKQVNDLYGHTVGDAVLVSFCRITTASIRAVDLFGRFGGEEFVLFMPNCPMDTARARLERLQQALASAVVSRDQPALRCTFSAGLVAMRRDKDVHHAIRRADRLLYRAKADGRACVRMEV